MLPSVCFRILEYWQSLYLRDLTVLVVTFAQVLVCLMMVMVGGSGEFPDPYMA